MPAKAFVQLLMYSLIQRIRGQARSYNLISDARKIPFCHKSRGRDAMPQKCACPGKLAAERLMHRRLAHNKKTTCTKSITVYHQTHKHIAFGTACRGRK